MKKLDHAINAGTMNLLLMLKQIHFPFEMSIKNKEQFSKLYD